MRISSLMRLMDLPRPIILSSPHSALSQRTHPSPLMTFTPSCKIMSNFLKLPRSLFNLRQVRLPYLQVSKEPLIPSSITSRGPNFSTTTSNPVVHISSLFHSQGRCSSPQVPHNNMLLYSLSPTFLPFHHLVTTCLFLSNLYLPIEFLARFAER
jgi:hypothetical protein